MEEGNIYGRMENPLMENIKWIKNKDLEYFIGQMENNIKDFGLMVNNMEMV